MAGLHGFWRKYSAEAYLAAASALAGESSVTGAKHIAGVMAISSAMKAGPAGRNAIENFAEKRSFWRRILAGVSTSLKMAGSWRKWP